MPNHATQLCSLLLLLCTCALAPSCNSGSGTSGSKAARTTLTGDIRYQEGSRLLEATLLMNPVPGKAPVLFNNPVPKLIAAGPGNFKVRRAGVNFPGQMPLQVPCGEQQSIDCNLNLSLRPPTIDSFPTRIDRTANNSFYGGAAPLAEAENLVMFFNPTDGSTPRKIIIQGPSSSNFVRLPPGSLGNIPAGDYNLYLIKQQVARDSTSALQHSLQLEYYTRTREVSVVN